MALSELAEQLLRTHAQHPNQPTYEVELLGSLFRDSELQRLNDAYRELLEQSLVERSGAAIRFFGATKSLYRLTQTGADHAVRETAA